MWERKQFVLKSGFIELSIEFGDFLIFFFKNSAWCAFPLLFHLSGLRYRFLVSSLPGVPGKAVVLVVLPLTITLFYDRFRFTSKWETGLSAESP